MFGENTTEYLSLLCSGTIGNYDEKTQLFVLQKNYRTIRKYYNNYRKFLTPYMKEDFDKLPLRLPLNDRIFDEIKNDKADWRDLSRFYDLSEDFIRKHQDKVDWGLICVAQDLSEKFIIEFQDKLEWGKISCYQKLSEEFIKEHNDKIYFFGLVFKNYRRLSSYSKEMQRHILYEISDDIKYQKGYLQRMTVKINLLFYSFFMLTGTVISCPSKLNIPSVFQ